jgi:hypothetical protein
MLPLQSAARGIKAMRIRWAAVIALTGIAATCAAAAPSAPDALAAIDDCIAQVDADTFMGLGLITTHCPNLQFRLQSSEWAAWLPAGWQDRYHDRQAGWQGDSHDLSVRDLAALRMVVARELALRTDARLPKVAVLRPILSDLAARNPPLRGWWQSVRNWLRELFAPESKDRSNWYERLSSRVSLSEALIEIVAYATFALIVLFAAYIVVNEWRASGAQRRRAGGRRTDGHAQRHPVRPLSWHDVESAAPNERPRVLLELIAARLTAARRLPAARALTVRELTRAAELSDATDRERLDELALASERMRFGFAEPAPAGVARVLARGRELFERLAEPQAERS